MTTKTPVRATFSGSTITGLAEYQSGEFIPLTHGGLGASLSIGSAGQVLKVNGAGNAIEFGAVEAIINIDGATDLTGATLQASDQIMLSDGGTEGRVTLSQLDTLFSGTTQTLTNKTLTSPTINNPTIAGGTFSGTFTGTMDATGMVLSGASPLVFEGATDDAAETTLAFTDPTVDRTITFPNATGTIVLEATGSTLTNKSIDLGNNTISGSLAEFNTALQDDSFAGLAATQTLTNKTLTSVVLNTGVSGSAILDEDDLSSNSATQLATQQSIKAYVDAISTTLTLAADSGSNDDVVVGTDTLTFAGGTGIDSTVSNNQISYAIDSTVVTLTGTQTLTNKTLTSPTITGTGAIAGTFTGNITGDVTGNADTATALETARTIGGTSFDGSANIAVALSTAATTLETARTIGGVSFDGSANINLPGVNTSGNQDTSGNAATATTLETARTIAGQSFDGSANITIASTDLSNTSNITLNDATQTLTNKTLTTPVIAEIDATGDFTLDAAGDILLDAAGNDVKILNAGTELARFVNNSQNLIVKNPNQDKDITISGNDGGSNVDALTFDMSDAGAATFNSNVTVGGNAVITGNLTVNGSTTTLSTTNSTIEDRLIELGTGTTGTPGNDMGLVFERGDSDNAFIGWDESTDKFIVGTGTFTGASTGNLTITTGTLVANLEGNVTGDVTGNVTGDVTGNADTATALATARNIGGVSFDGSANINLPGVNTSGNQDTSGNAATATALETARTIAGQSFDGTGNITIASTDLSNTSDIVLLTSTQTLTNKTLTSPTITGTGAIAGTFTGDITGDVTGNADTATTLATARTIAGQSFDGSANITIASTDLSNTSDIVLLTSTQTLTNKTLTSPTINAATITGEVTFAGDVNFDSNTLFVDTSANRVGIGSTTLSQPFTVHNTSSAQIHLRGGGPGIRFSSDEGGSNDATRGFIGFATNSNAFINGTSTGDLAIRGSTDGNIVFGDNGGEYARFTDGGHLQLKGNIVLEGATDNTYETTLTVVDPTADRTITFQNGSGTVAFLTDVTGGSTPGNFTTITLDNNITFEGATADDYETTLTVADPTADRTVTIPDATGTIVLRDTTDTLTNKTLTSPVIAAITSTADIDLTATNDVNIPANVGLTFGNDGEKIEGDGTNLTISSSGTTTLDSVGNIILDADSGGTVIIADNGSSLMKFFQSSGYVALESMVSDNDLKLRGNDGGSYFDALTLDMSDAGSATFNNNISVGGNATITGNLTVNGTTTTANTTNTVISDRLIELGNGTTGTPGNDMGIVLERGDSDNAFIGFDESTDKFIVGTGTFTGASTGNLTITTGTLVANLEGNVTGDVTGNADTATALATARTIGGTSFDGTANIAVNLAATATTLATARNIGGVSFDGSANINLPGVNTSGNQDTSGNAATATALETARTIAGQSFDGTGNITIASTDLSNTSNIALLDGTQTLTNKTLTSPTINGATFGAADVTFDTSTLHIDSTNDRVGIGTTSPSTYLAVRTPDTSSLVDALHLDNPNAAGRGVALSFQQGNNRKARIKSFFDATTNWNLAFDTEDTANALIINDNGNVGVGTTTPSTKLEVSGTITSTAFSGPLTGDVTGNADTATTLATARTIAGQSFDGSANITIASTDLSNTSNITLNDATQTLTNKTLTSPVIANITSTENISLNSSQSITLDVDDKIFLDSGSNGIVELKNDGTSYGKLFAYGGFKIESLISDQDLLLRGNDGGSFITALSLDMSEAGAATFNSTVTASGFVGDVTGNADTATALETARTIAGQSFDGTSNITIAATDLSDTDQSLSTTDNVTFNDMTVSGNLTVSGTTTTVNTETINLADNTITLNSNETGTPSQDGGIEIERGTSTNKTLVWNETTDKWTVGSETFVAGTFEGALTGNVTGDVTGDVTGNADTATALATARTIGGVSFDGSANINLPGVNTSGNQDTSGNAATATALETARTIAGQSFDGSANITIASTDLSNTSNIALLDGTQTLTNKTLTSPTISGPTITGDATFDTNTLHIDSTNNRIGIGTTSPAVALDLQQINPSEGFRVRRHNSSGQYIDISETDGSRHEIKAVGDKEFRMVNATTEPDLGWHFYRNGSERFRILGDGLITLPSGAATLVGDTTTQTLTNKTIDASSNTISNIGDSQLTTGIDAAKISSGSVSNTEFDYLDGVTSSVQTQLDNKSTRGFAIAMAIAL